MSASERLAELGIELPEVAQPVASYVPAARHGNEVRTSGQLPFSSGKLTCSGKVGADVDPEDAYWASRTAALNALVAAADVAGGIDNIVQIRHVTGYVASAPDFIGQPAVINGASDLLGEVFGEAGEHTRSAVGVAVLPLGAPVEVELTCLVRGEK